MKISRLIDHLEAALLAVLLFGLVGLSGLQIVLRNGFDEGLVWIDPLLRLAVLWLGLLGAVAAARRGKNIQIDLLGHAVPPVLRRLINTITQLTAAAVCALICWHGTRMVLLEAEFGDTGVLGLPVWLQQSIIPLAFGLMAVIYLIASVIEAAGKGQSKPNLQPPGASDGVPRELPE
ncbi:MAG: TRAP transporter small permease [Pseudomonadota bacterium]